MTKDHQKIRNFVANELQIMKRLITLLCATLALGSCSRSVKFDIDGHLIENAANKVYLVVENASIDTLASATVGADNRFCMRGKVDEPTTAFVCDDTGNTLAVLLIEQSQLYLRPLPEGGYIAEGGPINDKYNLIMQRLSDIALQIADLDFSNPETEEAYESLVMKYHDILSTAITDNLDNLVGVELFLSQEARGMTSEDMRIRFKQFSPQMQSLSAMRQFADYIDIYARTEVGNKFIDLTLKNATDYPMALSDICNRGKWVLIDFWATWCDPCRQEIPLLREMYAKYALQGFEICSISIDSDKARWRDFITQNDMLWINLHDNAFETSPDDQLPAAEIYGLQSIPANFLVAPDGTIMARNLFGDVLKHELEHIFGDCDCQEITNNQQLNK